jgi:hypothetical protein
MKTIKDLFQKFEDKVASLEETPEVTDEEFREITYDLQFETDEIEFISDSERLVAERAFRYRIFKYFRLIERFIKAQQNLENQRDLWLTIIDLLNASKAFNTKKKEEIRGELLEDCFAELEKLNNTLHTQKTTTVEGNSEKANKPDTTVEGNASKFEESKKKGTGKVKPSVKPFNWQGTQAQLVYLIDQLIEHKFLSPISQTKKHRLTAQHFTVEGKSLNTKNLANARYNNRNTKKGKPKEFEKIEQIVSATQKQNP